MTISLPRFDAILEFLQSHEKLRDDPFLVDEKILRVAAIVFDNTEMKKNEIKQRIEYLFVQLDCKQSVTDKFKRRDKLLSALIQCGEKS